MTLTRRMETLIRSLRFRRGRSKRRLALCEGRRACREVAERRPDLIEFAFRDEAVDVSELAVEFTSVPGKRFKRLAATVNAQGVLMVARIPDPVPCGEPVRDVPFVVILDQIADPGNLGTILRTMKAVGLDEAWLTRGTADPFGDKAIRASVGLQFAMRFRRFETLEDVAGPLTDMGFAVRYRTDPHRGEEYHRIDNLFDRTALVFGGEARGAGLLPGAEPVRIAMPGGVESINVAQAATVIFFDYLRRKGG